MNLTRLTRKCFSEIVYLIFSAGIILSSTTVYSVQHRNISVGIAVIITAMLMVYEFIFVGKGKLKVSVTSSVFILYYMLMMLFFLLIRSNGNIFRNGSNFLILFPIFFLLFDIADSQELQKIFRTFVVMSTLIGLVSVVIFLMLQMNLIKPTGYMLLNWGDPPKRIAMYHNIYYLSQEERNTAFFPEAPAYNYFLCTALLCHEFYMQKKMNIVSILLVITIITSTSTTGYIALIIYAFYKISSEKSQSALKKLVKFLIVAIALGIGFIFIQSIFLEKLDSHSGEVRSAKMLTELAAFPESPLVGHGIGSYSAGSSNSITSLLADGGIFLWGIYYFPLFGILAMDFIQHRKINYCIVIYLFVFAVSVFQYYTLSIILAAFGWHRFLNKLLRKEPKQSLTQQIEYVLSYNMIKKLKSGGK